ncbi:MAG: pantoate--beta-alanine ligase [Clostridiales bacterium]|nr:pantoate--beta-alanine ligase [Clostridiales bacterium]
MRIITSKQEMRCLAQKARGQGQSIGFVPTMGYLHSGHISLMEAAREQNSLVAASIFVNPTQFGPNEDLARYPRNFASDSALAAKAGVDVLFCPEAMEMYPQGYVSYVETEGLGKRLCGKSRPGHFRGVCTVVLKLFNIVQPHRAYFGQKDAQQFIILKRMARDLDLDIEMVSMPIVREADGLAMSSRNVYLNAEERRQALVLSRALGKGKRLFAAGERDAAALQKAVQSELAIATLGRTDYAEIVDMDELLPIVKLDKPALLALAMYFGKTRLIDNTILI